MVPRTYYPISMCAKKILTLCGKGMRKKTGNGNLAHLPANEDYISFCT